METEKKRRLNYQRNEMYYVYDISYNLLAEFTSSQQAGDFCICNANTIRLHLDKKNRVGALANFYVKTQKINLIQLTDSI